MFYNHLPSFLDSGGHQAPLQREVWHITETADQHHEVQETKILFTSCGTWRAANNTWHTYSNTFVHSA